MGGELNKRILKFQKLLRENDIDIAFVSGLTNKEPNVQYLIGRRIDCSFLIIPKKRNSKLLVSKMEYSKAKRFVTHIEVVRFEKPLNELIEKLIRRHKAKVIGINKNTMSINELSMLRKKIKKKRFADISTLLPVLRSQKSKKEIGLIRKACSISDEIFQSTYANFKKFRTEEDVRAFLLSETYKRGCKPAFEPIVASGRNSGIVHYMGMDRKIGKGFCFIDYGIEYMSYKSDTTRVIFKGKPSVKELKMYNFMLEVQKKAVKMVKPGVKCSDIYKSVKKALGKYSENFTHGLGHGVGIEIHEHPKLFEESKEILEKGMIFTIEPGIYFPGKFGMRIEDTVLVTEKGHQVLTKVGKDLLLV